MQGRVTQAGVRVMGILASVLLLGVSVFFAGSEPLTSAPTPEPRLFDTWMSGQKDGFGTAYTYTYQGEDPSRVWFTITDGMLSESFYPTLDTPQIKQTRLSILGPGWVLREGADFETTITRPDPQALLYEVTETNKGHDVTIKKTIFTDPSNNSVVMDVQILSPQSVRTGLEVVPHLGGTGMSNTAAASARGLDFQGHNSALAVRTDGQILDFGATRHYVDDYTSWSSGQYGAWLFKKDTTEQTGPGEVMGNMLLASSDFRLVLGFGKDAGESAATAEKTLSQGAKQVAAEYKAGWHSYLASLEPTGLTMTAEAETSLMLIKAAEDKTFRGAIIAGPAFPWGYNRPDNFDDHGYNLVWPRDLYEAAIALWAWGDQATARDALNHLATIQRDDGGLWQNTRVDGTPYWGATQKDQVADAIMLAELVAPGEYWEMVKRAANYLAAQTPDTEQERWEEQGGYSPATLAAEIAGLRSAARQAERQGEQDLARQWQEVADSWDQQVEKWTFTTTGPLGSGYYLRISSTGEPDLPDELGLANGAGLHDARDVVDQSFLELVRLGVRSPDDPHILATLDVVDENIKVDTSLGPSWYRYNFDKYGDRMADGSTQGKLWPILTGERGLYEVSAGHSTQAREMLETMKRLANPAGIIAEQVDETGRGTGSTAPLIWSQATYLQLEASIQQGRVVGVITP